MTPGEAYDRVRELLETLPAAEVQRVLLALGRRFPAPAAETPEEAG